MLFLLRRRRNLERKTPLRAGGPALQDPPPWVGVGGMGGLVSDYPANSQVHLVPCKLVCGPLAASLLLTHCISDLIAFFGAGSRCVLNFFQANGLAPSGGHILFSSAKKEYGKKDAAQGGEFPALRTHPLGWGSGVRAAWYGLPDKLASASVPCKPVCGPLAASLLLTDCGCGLGDFFGAGSLCVLNFFQANGLSPSGGHILSSPAKKEYGKKDAA